MKLRRFFNLFAVLLMLSACSKSEKPQPDPGPIPPDPPKPVDSYFHIASEADLAHFLDTTSVNFTDTVVFDNDITVEGTLPCGADFGGVLDGKGHTINNCKSSTSLFAVNNGKICNLSLGSGCVFTPSDGIFGAFVCENKGELSGLQTTASIECNAAGNKNVCLGGIAAYCVSGACIKDCKVPSGSISVKLPLSASTDLPAVQLGGIVGSPFGAVENCECGCNILYEGSNVADVGGISGSDAYKLEGSAKSTTDYSGCTFSGTVTMRSSSSSKTFSTVGGIVGWPGKESTQKTCTKDCTFSGEITVEGTGKVHAGGIQGGSGNLENCTGKGGITVKSSSAESTVGGLRGYQFYSHTAKNCTVTGPVTSEVAIAGVGGLFGAVADQKSATGEGCKVACSVRNIDPDHNCTGMVVGGYAGTKQSITLGTSASPIEVEGNIDYCDGLVPITESSMKTSLCGSANSSASHVINAKYTGSATSHDYAEGYVRYDDGKPAVGVSVSDGMNVVYTDDKGYFKLEKLTADNWFIYISMPADAVLGKNVQGLPDFFYRYNPGRTQYDFNLKRQPVEDDFALFAMADIQSHYAIRSDGDASQTKTDIDRFGAETIPAIQTQIAAQGVNCYGVHLGDIVFSTPNRDSAVGMPQLRDHLSCLNMPVYHTMGNHDFTYFGSKGILEPDATSSTLFLKAQRSMESNFGPANSSFNRGNAHIVCMRNVLFKNDSDPYSYSAGISDEQYQWLVKDLAGVDRNSMVILCWHIPVTGNEGGKNFVNVLTLLKEFTNPIILSGHSHYSRVSSDIFNVTGIFEQVHAAISGTSWWGNIEGDGCPNGYTVYRIAGNAIKDSYFIGVNAPMNVRDYQMRIYRGNIKTGGKFCHFQLPFDKKTFLINVFNYNFKWKVRVYENGVYAGTLDRINTFNDRYVTEKGGTYLTDEKSSYDWYAVGYLIGVTKRGTGSETGYYINNFHMFKYVAGSDDAKITVEVTDPYGNVYTCSDIVENGPDGEVVYPDYVKAPIAVNY